MATATLAECVACGEEFTPKNYQHVCCNRSCRKRLERAICNARYRAKLKQDPARYAEVKRKENARYRAKLKQDPVRYAKFLAHKRDRERDQNRERMKDPDYRDRIRGQKRERERADLAKLRLQLFFMTTVEQLKRRIESDGD